MYSPFILSHVLDLHLDTARALYTTNANERRVKKEEFQPKTSEMEDTTQKMLHVHRLRNIDTSLGTIALFRSED